MSTSLSAPSKINCRWQDQMKAGIFPPLQQVPAATAEVMLRAGKRHDSALSGCVNAGLRC